MGDAKIDRDLFGDLVVLPSGRRGRPSHRWTKSNADRVILGLAMGYSDPEIALGLGVSAPTLRKHYFSELKRRAMQRARFELWRAETLARLADEGNVGAMKELGKLVDKRDRHLAEERLRAADDARAPKVGKKEIRAAAATAAQERDDLLKPGYGPN